MNNQYFFKSVLRKQELKESVLTESFIEDFVLKKWFSSIAALKDKIQGKYNQLIGNSELQIQELRRIKTFFSHKFNENLCENDGVAHIELGKKEQDAIAIETGNKDIPNNLVISKKEAKTKFWHYVVGIFGASMHMGILLLAYAIVLLDTLMGNPIFGFFKDFFAELFKAIFSYEEIENQLEYESMYKIPGHYDAPGKYPSALPDLSGHGEKIIQWEPFENPEKLKHVTDTEADVIKNDWIRAHQEYPKDSTHMTDQEADAMKKEWIKSKSQNDKGIFNKFPRW